MVLDLRTCFWSEGPPGTREQQGHPGIKLHGYFFCQERSLCRMQSTLLGNVLNCLHGELLSRLLVSLPIQFHSSNTPHGQIGHGFHFSIPMFFFFFFFFFGNFILPLVDWFAIPKNLGGKQHIPILVSPQENVKLFGGLERDISSLPITPPWVSFRTNTFFCVALGFELLADANKKNSSFFIFYIYKNTLNMI